MEFHDDKIKYYNKVFDSADADKDGKITIKELKNFLRGKSKENISDRDIMRVFTDLDLDGDGNITREEFLTEMVKLSREEARQQYEEKFRKWDKNGDGKLSKEEIKAAFSEADLVTYTDEEIDMMIKKADKNKDGYINWEEFLHSMFLND